METQDYPQLRASEIAIFALLPVKTSAVLLGAIHYGIGSAIADHAVDQPSNVHCSKYLIWLSSTGVLLNGSLIRCCVPECQTLSRVRMLKSFLPSLYFEGFPELLQRQLVAPRRVSFHRGRRCPFIFCVVLQQIRLELTLVKEPGG